MPAKKSGRKPRTEPWPVCKVEECEKTTKGGSYGLCRTHYAASRRGEFDQATGKRLREPQRVSSYGPGAHCAVVGCLNRPKAQGLCSAHWQRRQSGASLEEPVGPPRGRAPNTTLCCVPRCQKRANNKGMCQPHAEQRRRGILGDDGTVLRERKKGGRLRKHRRVTSQGYVLVTAPEGREDAQHDGYILEHRLVVSLALGRPLEAWEIVHHKNGNRQDNRPENLELLDGRARLAEGHPPGHEVSVDEARKLLEHLKHNDPASFSNLLQELQ